MYSQNDWSMVREKLQSELKRIISNEWIEDCRTDVAPLTHLSPLTHSPLTHSLTHSLTHHSHIVVPTSLCPEAPMSHSLRSIVRRRSTPIRVWPESGGSLKLPSAHPHPCLNITASIHNNETVITPARSRYIYTSPSLVATVIVPAANPKPTKLIAAPMAPTRPCLTSDK